MADMTSTNAKLIELQQQYLAGMQAKMNRIEQHWLSLSESNWPQDGLQALQRMLHSIASAAEKISLSEVAKAARDCEFILQFLLGMKCRPSENQRMQIEHYFAALKQLAMVSSGGTSGCAAAAAQPALRTVPDDVRKTVFLYEGDAHKGQDSASQLRSFGYVVYVVDSIAELYKMIDENCPEALILDYTFPENHPTDHPLCELVNTIKDKQIPFIFLSFRDDIQARLQSVRLGASAHLAKPLDVGALVDRLDVLTRKNGVDPYKVLILDDSAFLAKTYANILQNAGMTTMEITDPMVIFQALREFRPDLVLMDVYMPNCDGTELAKVIRQIDDYVSVPIVYLSAETDVTKQLAALSLGGDDFLTKPIKEDHLIAAVVTKAQRYRTLRSFMVRDSLTGLLNHTTMKERLVEEIDRAMRHGNSLAYAMIDIDRFKLVNDSYGHPTGDRVLKSLARILQQRLRKTDIVGRYGGEEFAVILLNANLNNALERIDQIRCGFSEIKHHHGNSEFSVTFSAGIAAFPQYADAAAIGGAADRSLYQAKRDGRNRVVCASGD